MLKFIFLLIIHVVAINILSYSVSQSSLWKFIFLYFLLYIDIFYFSFAMGEIVNRKEDRK